MTIDAERHAADAASATRRPAATTEPPRGLRRRDFIAGTGGLVVWFAIPVAPLAVSGEARAQGEGGGAASDAPKLPGSLAKEPRLSGWIRIDERGHATVFTGKAELGQGVKTALVQVAAEELVLTPERVAIVTADTERTADEGYTAGSNSMKDSATAIRHAAAQVRTILVGLAAERLGVPAERLVVANGMVGVEARAQPNPSAPAGSAAGAAGTSPGSRIGYGELVAKLDLDVPAQPRGALRPASSRVVMGKSLARLDIPAKLSGGAAYVHDLRLPGMVHGRILRPPSPAAQLRSFDAIRAESMRGVIKVVRDGRFVAVVAEREYAAVVARRALAEGAVWDERPTWSGSGDVEAWLRSAASQDFVILERGSVAAAPAASGASLAATYTKPYQAHASIGPSCAVALLQDGKLTVWTHSQGVYPLRGALAELLGIARQRVHCIHVEGSGCYGHNGADDAAADAALLARALPGRPVRVQWMREDEQAWEPYGPPMLARVAAVLGADRRIAEWHYDVWSATHSTRPGRAGDLLAGTHLARPFEPSPPRPIPQPEGGGDRNAIPLYALPNAKVVHHFIREMPLRVSALRSLGAYHNVFAIESFIDELARLAGADPVEFRIGHTVDPRAVAVMRLAAERFGWSTFERAPTRGRGFAFARYKNLGAYAAIAVEADVQRDSGRVRIVRATAAVDSGEVISPDGIKNQIEGGIVQSTSWTLHEEVGSDGTRITTRDWGGYPILRFSGVPETIDVHVVDRPGEPFLGTGEAAQGPTAAAIANAVADATGARLRDVPFTHARVRAAEGV